MELGIVVKIKDACTQMRVDAANYGKSAVGRRLITYADHIEVLANHMVTTIKTASDTLEKAYALRLDEIEEAHLRHIQLIREEAKFHNRIGRFVQRVLGR